MKPPLRRFRARVAAATLMAVTAMSVAVPLLDRGLDPGRLALSEAGHARGYVDHNHGVCLQHSATAWSPAVGTDLPSERFVRRVDSPCRAVVHPVGATLLLHNPRAPPRV